MNKDVSNFCLEVLDLLRDKDIQLLYAIDINCGGGTLLHLGYIIMNVNYDCKHSRLLFLKKIVDQFPSELLSVQDNKGETPYDYINVRVMKRCGLKMY